MACVLVLYGTERTKAAQGRAPVRSVQPPLQGRSGWTKYPTMILKDGHVLSINHAESGWSLITEHQLYISAYWNQKQEVTTTVHSIKPMSLTGAENPRTSHSKVQRAPASGAPLAELKPTPGLIF